MASTLVSGDPLPTLSPCAPDMPTLPSLSFLGSSICKAGDLSLTPGRGKEMATHSSILGWRIPWADEPGGLQPMGPWSRT